MTIVKQEKQSWLETWIETISGIIVGLALATAGNWAYMYLYGVTMSLQAVFGLGLFMTGLSLARQLVMRRLFEHIRVHRIVPRLLAYLKRENTNG